MSLSEFALRRPVLAMVASLLLVILGAAALWRLPVRELPRIDTAEVTVSVTYEGAAPDIVDAEVTTVIEDAIATIAGVRSISSESERGSNRTVITFDPGRDIDQAANDVRAAVARVRDELPDAADAPEVEKNDDQDEPIIRLTLTSDRMTAAELTDFADRRIVDRLSRVPGVASVDIDGERAFAMRVWLDRERMAARGVTVGDISEAIRRNNVELPAGRIETPSRQIQVRTDTRFSTPEEFSELVVRRGADGYPVRLGDVADIEQGVENDESYFRAAGETAVGLGILRRAQANTVAISDAVRVELDALRADLPAGASLEIASDDALFIRASIRQVLITLAIAVALVVGVIFAFLASARATIVPAVTIPIALVGACAGIWAFGFSINLITLFALILAIGLVVDDSIVVLENVQRRIDEGASPLAASARGARQVGFAVIATSLALIAVFVPIAFLQGRVGRLFTEFGIVLAIAVVASTFVALTLAPVLCARLLKPGAREGRFGRGVDRALGAVADAYRRSLAAALRAPWLVLGLAALVAGSAAAAYQRVPSALTPEEDRGAFSISVSAPQGANLDYTDAVVREIEGILAPLRGDGPIDTWVAIVGRYDELRRAYIAVSLAPWEERDRSVGEVIDEIEPQLDQIVRANVRTGRPAGLGLGGSGSGLRVIVGGAEFESVAAQAEVLADALGAEPGVSGVEIEWSPNQPSFVVSIDRDRARAIGIEARDVSEALRALIASADVGEYADRGRQYPVVLQAREADRADRSAITDVYVRTRAGGLAPLDGLVEIETRATPRALTRYDRLPSVEVSARLGGEADLGSAIEATRRIADEELEATTRISFEGQASEYLQTARGTQIVFGLALVVVFLVLAAQFESFLHPIAILLTVPLGVAGALFTILFTGQTLNVFSQVGIVLLIGLMAKNGILIVEFANQLRDDGRSVRDATLEAATLRLRPILMTVGSTLLGAVPLVLSTGAGAESRAAIGAVVLGGLSVATVFTLYVTPVLYDLVAGYTRSGQAASRALDEAIVQEGRAAE